MSNNFTFPPAGTLLPPAETTSSTGGLVWPRFVAEKAGLKSFNYAIGGSSCSTDIVERSTEDFGMDLEQDFSFPTVLHTQLPHFFADLEFEHEETLYGPEGRTAENTVYRMWIGGTDLGIGGFLNGMNKETTTLSSLAECNWALFDEIYKSGGRQFVVFGTHPLHLAPMYLPEDIVPVNEEAGWPPMSSYGVDEFNGKMTEYATSVNTMLESGAPFQAVIENRWPGATISYFNAQQLLADVVETPEKYLEAPVADSTEVYRWCRDFEQTDCEIGEGSLASYVWFDNLHSSERVEVVADEFIKVISGESKYGKTYHS